MQPTMTTRILQLAASIVLGAFAGGAGACATSAEPTALPEQPRIADVPVDTRPSAVADDDPSAPQTDDQITRAISSRLRSDPDTRLHSIEVATAEGVVTLSGVVGSVAARNVAVSIVNDISGVVRVVPNLMVGDEQGDSLE